jgi:hypothetical protein
MISMPTVNVGVGIGVGIGIGRPVSSVMCACGSNLCLNENGEPLLHLALQMSADVWQDFTWYTFSRIAVCVCERRAFIGRLDIWSSLALMQLQACFGEYEQPY